MTPLRARVYYADIGYGRKPFLCVSNNARNQKLNSFLAVRITTTAKPELASIIPLDSADAPLIGSILCDEIVPIYRDEISAEAGAISLRTMMAVAVGLKAALAL